MTIDYPLNDPQYQIWLSGESCPDKQLFTESALFTFPEPISPRKLNTAVNELVKQTECLRIRLKPGVDGPRQYDAGYAPFSCRVVPLAGKAEAERYFARRSRRAFALCGGSLFAAEILTLPKETRILFQLHHIIADSYGMAAVYGRFLSLLAGEEPAPLSPFLPHTGHAPGGAVREVDRLFWREALSGAAPSLSRRPVPKDLSRDIAWTSRPVGAERSARIRAFAETHKVTPYCVFLAAYALLLSRNLSAEDLVILVPRLNRDEDQKKTAGMFTVAVPVRLKVGREQSFPDLCLQVKEQSARAAAHKACSLSQILSDLEQDGISGALSHFTLSYQTFQLPKSGLDFTYDLHLGAAMTNLLTLHLLDWTDSGDYRMELDYRKDYYAPEEIDQIGESLLSLLDQGLSAHSAPCGAFEVLTAGEKLLLQGRYAGPAPFHDLEETIVSLFARQVEKSPQARALSGLGPSYTYEELDAASLRVCRSLMAAGVKPGDFVGFLLPRTTALPVILLGILKAGAAFVPIDPAYPEERVRYILSDSGAGFLVADGDRGVPEGCLVLRPDYLLAGASPSLPPPSILPDWLCYIIYTSGTTGKPKGVMIEHRGVVNFVQPDNNPFNRDVVYNGKGIVAVGSICFDISMFELFSTLLNGVPVVFADENGMNNPEALADYLLESGANILHCTPSRLLSYLEEPKFHKAMGGVDIVLAAGESFTKPLLDALRKATPARLYNGYGPTEVTIGATVGQITDEITIGSAIAGARLYLLDKEHRLVPGGVCGEIAVGGLGLARGYLGRPELTAQRFIVLKDGPVEERVYLTGDLGCGLSDGQLLYLGRNDDQIKLRGLRIELGEIESCAESYPGVRQCAAIIKHIDGREHLCCYYSADTEFDPERLKQHAAGFLARYMVPDLFLFLPELPHTANGKIDKRALQAMEAKIEHVYIPPRTATERLLCDIFAQVLGEDRVGITDSFFECGGTSLLAARVVLLAKHEGLELGYGSIFDHPTPRDLAKLLDDSASPARAASLLTGRQDICTEEEVACLTDVLYTNWNYKRGLKPLGNVLLTGATGFLGIHVLYELMTAGYGAVYCVVRPKGDLTPEKRLKGALFYYFENNFAEAFGKRLFAVDGNLLREDLADLPEGVRIDTVINCAADVSHFGVDNKIRQTNVDGVRNVIAFCQARNAALIHISTLSVGGFIDQELADIGVSLSERRLWIHQDLSNVYLESKFTAEKLILLETRRGLKGKIMRVGNLQGRITDGEFQMNQATNGFSKLLQSMVQSGKCPESLSRSWINFSPVDAVSRAICRMAGSGEQYTVFHIFDSNDLPVRDLLRHLEEIGYPIEILSDPAFDEFMLEAAEDPAMSSVLDGFLTRVTGGRHMTEAPCESSFSVRALEQEDFRWPEITDSYLHNYLVGLDTLGAFDP